MEAATLLRSAGLRRTPVRTGVIEALSRATHPLSVHDLLELLPRGTDAVTVYRTLATLVDASLVSRVRGDDRTWLYELTSDRAEHLHAHFVCVRCGAVECLADIQMPPLPSRLTKLGKGYDLQSQELTLRGLCPKCH